MVTFEGLTLKTITSDSFALRMPTELWERVQAQLFKMSAGCAEYVLECYESYHEILPDDYLIAVDAWEASEIFAALFALGETNVSQN